MPSSDQRFLLKGTPLNKKQKILESAIRLFAGQGFEGTTTFQITKEAGVTEPLLYYHFDGKDDLFTCILSTTFAEYFFRLDQLEEQPYSQFEKIENLIDFHFQFLKDFPDETFLCLSICPTRLKDPELVCTRNLQQQKKRLNSYLRDCLQKGIETKEFNEVPIQETVALLIALINGLLRQRSLNRALLKQMKKTTIEFCQRSLVKSPYAGRNPKY